MYDMFLDLAFKNKDNDSIINCFLDILDYENIQLKPETYAFVAYSNKDLLKDKVFYQILKVIFVIKIIFIFLINFKESQWFSQERK